jgi:hypothetical protein
MIIDYPGHYTPRHRRWRRGATGRSPGSRTPSAASALADLHISDDDLLQSIEPNQLRSVDERGIDMAIFSPRATFIARTERPRRLRWEGHTRSDARGFSTGSGRGPRADACDARPGRQTRRCSRSGRRGHGPAWNITQENP